MAYEPIRNDEAGLLQVNPAAYGVDYFADTDTHTGSWYRMDIIDTTVINAIVDGTDKQTGRVYLLTTGSVNYGRFTSVDLTSGKVLMYRSKPNITVT